MKELYYSNVDSVWIRVELFKVKDFFNASDYLNVTDEEYHERNEVFLFDSISEAIYVTKTLLGRDDDYTYAMFFVCRYNENPELSEITDEEKLIVDSKICIGDMYFEEASSEGDLNV